MQILCSVGWSRGRKNGKSTEYYVYTSLCNRRLLIYLRKYTPNPHPQCFFASRLRPHSHFERKIKELEYKGISFHHNSNQVQCPIQQPRIIQQQPPIVSFAYQQRERDNLSYATDSKVLSYYYANRRFSHVGSNLLDMDLLSLDISLSLSLFLLLVPCDNARKAWPVIYVGHPSDLMVPNI